jgi:hypothetical protein
MKIRPGAAELFLAGGRTDTQDEGNSSFSQFWECNQKRYRANIWTRDLPHTKLVCQSLGRNGGVPLHYHSSSYNHTQYKYACRSVFYLVARSCSRRWLPQRVTRRLHQHPYPGHFSNWGGGKTFIPPNRWNPSSKQHCQNPDNLNFNRSEHLKYC